MTKAQALSPNILVQTINACLDNGERLLEETYDLEFREPSSSRFFLVMIAQEEFAKAFIVFLIKERIVPFSPPVRRAINDHVCKQLVGMIMDYMIMHWEEIEELKAAIRRDHDVGDRLPNDVGSALEILAYEKIGRWAANNRVWAEGPAYDRSALQIAEGKKDRRKQDALYVRIGGDGRACSTPATITDEETRDELERARRYSNFVRSALNGGEPPCSFDRKRFDKIMSALTILFSQNSLADAEPGS